MCATKVDGDSDGIATLNEHNRVDNAVPVDICLDSTRARGGASRSRTDEGE